MQHASYTLLQRLLNLVNGNDYAQFHGTKIRFYL
jgi:hypothetical protein